MKVLVDVEDKELVYIRFSRIKGGIGIRTDERDHDEGETYGSYDVVELVIPRHVFVELRGCAL